MSWMLENWEIMLAVFYLAEKVVKLSPSKKDDILVDMVWNGIKGVLKK